MSRSAPLFMCLLSLALPLVVGACGQAMAQEVGQDELPPPIDQFTEETTDQESIPGLDEEPQLQGRAQFEERGQFQEGRQFDQQFDQQFDSQLDQPADQRFDGRASGRQSVRQDGQRSFRQDFNFGAQFSDTGDGLAVTSINQGTLAAQIGLEENDQILAIDGRTIRSESELNRLLMQSRSIDQRIPVAVRRGDQRTTLYIQPRMLRDTFVFDERGAGTDLGLVFAPAERGQIVVRDVTGGWANVVGLRPSDVLLSVAGRTITSPAQLETFVFRRDFVDVDRVPVVVMRDGRRVVLHWEPAAWDNRAIVRDRSDFRGENAWLGVTLDTRYPNSAVVREVVPNSPADHSGVRRGDWIVEVSGRRINSPNHLTRVIDSLQPGEEVEIRVARRVARDLYVTLAGERADFADEYREDFRDDVYYEPRQALRPIYDPDLPPQPLYRGEIVEEFDADLDRRGIRDRIGPGERGLRDRLDRDEIAEPPALRRP